MPQTQHLMKKDLVIFGTGDIAQIASYYFATDTDRTVAAFTVNRAYLTQTEFEGRPVVAFEDLEAAYPPETHELFIAVSYARMNRVREEKFLEAKQRGYTLATYISSRCSYLTPYACGENCFIFEDNTIQPFVRIGNNVTLWSGNHIGHHSVIHDHVFVSSHVVISGHCEIGSRSFLGVNATLHNNVKIAEETLVAAGSVISKSTRAKDVWLPARSTVFDKKSDEIGF